MKEWIITAGTIDVRELTTMKTIKKDIIPTDKYILYGMHLDGASLYEITAHVKRQYNVDEALGTEELKDVVLEIIKGIDAEMKEREDNG